MDVATLTHDADWIERDADLSVALDRWRGAPAIALDTEFVRTDTFFAKLGLIQLADGVGSALIDPLNCDPAPLFALLAEPGVTKVMHSASEDIAILLHQGRIDPAPLFDTQIAAALAGMGPTLSYPALVKELLDVDLDKGEQRSDWLRRPLSAAQQHYAANDVTHLLDVYDLLRDRLEQLGRLEWVLEDGRRLIENVRRNQGPQQQYERFKLGWKLDAVGRTVLWQLLQWREEDAARLDRPRQRILQDDALLHLAINQPGVASELEATPRMSPGMRRKIGPRLLELIEQAKQLPADQRPQPQPRPLGPDSKPLMKALKQVVSVAAESLELAPEILCSRRDYVALIRDRALPSRLRGWRHDIVGVSLLQRLEAG